jgi:CHAT domain/SIR2-like domain
VPKGFSELEIVVQRDATDALQVTAQHRIDTASSITPITRIELDPQDPILYSGDPAAAGALLSKAIFSSPYLRDAFIRARAYCATQNVLLRVRMRVDPSASALHAIPWETITHPVDGTPLLKDADCVFSRYLFSREFRLPNLRPRQQVQAVIAIANPRGLDETFDRVQVEMERDIASNSLFGLNPSMLTASGDATLANILHKLREGADILYLVCHGAIGPLGPALWLEDQGGGAALVPAGELVAGIGALDRPPSLVVLCSCQSAGTGRNRNMLSAVGPLLAQVGVPAVLAMQGKLSMATAQGFMKAFFRELSDHGEVDRAASTARSAVMNQPDWWLPVLFTRLDSARIWYPPGFGKVDDGNDPWRGLIDNLKAERSTPILGPGMCESYFGTRREIAALWNETYRYPMSGADTEDLPRVAQYMAATRYPAFPRDEYLKYVYRRIVDKHRAHLSTELAALPPSQMAERLAEVVSVIGRALRKGPAGDDDPYAVVASYHLPVYITTDPSDLLVDALVERGVRPRVRVLRWNDASAQRDNDCVEAAPKDAPSKPTPEFPIVLKLFGDLAEPKSLVITEDHFFDYLTQVASTKDAVPPSVRRRLCDGPLLFVGFQPDAWDFRVLFMSLLQIEGKDLSRDYEHFSVQMDPNSILDPASARRYIEKYLQAKGKLRLYWGDVATFLGDLKQKSRD